MQSVLVSASKGIFHSVCPASKLLVVPRTQKTAHTSLLDDS